MDSTRQLSHFAPADQPTSVHELADRLFPAYSVRGGGVRLAGCRLEDRLFVRLKFRHGAGTFALFVDADGREVANEMVDSLGMGTTTELERPPDFFEPAVDRAVEAGTRLAAQRVSGEGAAPELTATAVLWCKFAEGKLRFTIGNTSVDLPFSDWARTLCPPPFICRHSGVSTFELAATDDGRIAAAGQIVACEETGRRMLVDDLVTCSVTSRRVAPELIETCPVTDQPVLKSEMVRCGCCDQRVSPHALQKDICVACRELDAVDRNDSRLVRLIEAYPQLGDWPKWQLSETAAVYIGVGTVRLKRLLVVVEKESLDVKRLATANRFFGGWKTVEPSQYDSLLR